ncbi:hypothetical protein J2X69_000023 [Algoriphagus sp. 4150]|uniref:hypothetical protein n=1 Tax=Algoriphagus sp. 4150 TaxID=2817756 RepID=UPI0028649082|nr:hypothetical protein [Algoriphagus sp. 4150]MDR7127695.1 hypothetical protein [Algoriphagus sp. 4150]
MNNICCLLDACTVINLIYIDNDDSLLKKLSSLEIHINDIVFSEIRDNVYNRILNLEMDKYSNKLELRQVRKDIDQKLSFFRGKKNNNQELFRDLGSDYFNKIAELTKYNKRTNGELCSTAHALYLSRMNENKIFFYTDDYPAKDYFSTFFNYQQIGHIKDSVDLLILLFWLDDKFSVKMLDDFLSELHSQYVTQISDLKSCLRNFYAEKVNAKFKREKKELAHNITALINNLDRMEFNSMKLSWQYFEKNSKKHNEVFNLIKNYHSVFELEATPNSDTLLGKIVLTREMIKSKKIYKWGDICTI